MSSCGEDRVCGRREAMLRLAQGALALAVLPACGAGPEQTGHDEDGGTPGDAGAGPECLSSHGTEQDGWVPLPLASYPALAEVGGSVIVKDPSKLLDVVIARLAPDCLAAVWHICSHGACEVAFSPAEQHVECPCHGSRFAMDGSILRGPATQPLAAYPVVQDGDTLWIRRWA